MVFAGHSLLPALGYLETEPQRQVLHHALMQHVAERGNSALVESTWPAAGWDTQNVGRADDVARAQAAPRKLADLSPSTTSCQPLHTAPG